MIIFDSSRFETFFNDENNNNPYINLPNSEVNFAKRSLMVHRIYTKLIPLSKSQPLF